MLDYFSKEEFPKQRRFRQLRDEKLKPILETMTRLGIDPNTITYLSMALFFLSLLFIYDHPFVGGFFLLLHCLLDGLDGPLARYQRKESNAGSILDILNDQLGIIFLPAAAIYFFETDPIYAYFFGLFYTLDIILVVVLNTLRVRVRFVLRVKYLYYGLFFLSAYLKYDLLYYFHFLFGIFYMIHAAYLFVLLNRYLTKRSA